MVMYMAKIKAEQIPKTMQFLQVDLPALLLTVGKIEDTDEYWEEVANGCDAVYRKHESKFAKKMLQAFADYLEEEWQLSRKKNRGDDIAKNKRE